MKIIAIIVRTLLGLAFIVFGLNAFYHFIRMEPPGGAAGDFMNVLFQSHYYYAIAVVQIAGGFFCLTGLFTPLGLTLLGPIMVNIILFHIFLEPKGLPMAAVFVVLYLFLVGAYRSAFAGLVRPFRQESKPK